MDQEGSTTAPSLEERTQKRRIMGHVEHQINDLKGRLQQRRYLQSNRSSNGKDQSKYLKFFIMKFALFSYPE